MAVGKAYLKFYELSEDAERPWLPYIIRIAWIVIANILSFLGLKNNEFAGTSQSLPYQRKTPKYSNYKSDAGNEPRSQDSYDGNFSASGYSRPQDSQTGHGQMMDNG